MSRILVSPPPVIPCIQCHCPLLFYIIRGMSKILIRGVGDKLSYPGIYPLKGQLLPKFFKFPQFCKGLFPHTMYTFLNKLNFFQFEALGLKKANSL